MKSTNSKKKLLSKIGFWFLQIAGLCYLWRLLVPLNPKRNPSSIVIRLFSIYVVLIGIFYPIYELNISRLENIYGSSVELLGNTKNKSFVIQQIGELQSVKIPVEPNLLNPRSLLQYSYYKPIQERSENIVQSYIQSLTEYRFKNHYMTKDIQLKQLDSTLNYNFSGPNDFTFLSIDECTLNQVEFKNCSINKRLMKERNLNSILRIRDCSIKSISIKESTISNFSLVENKIDLLESDQSVFYNSKFESNEIRNYGSIKNTLFINSTFYLSTDLAFQECTFFNCKFICTDCGIEQMNEFQIVKGNNTFSYCTLYDDNSQHQLNEGKLVFPDSLSHEFITGLAKVSDNSK